MNTHKILYIIAGANGSGKSTLAMELLPSKSLEFLNADEIAKEIAPDAINSVPITAGKAYYKRLRKYFKENKSFAVESTLSGKNIRKIINNARQNGYKIFLVFVYLDNCTSCIERVKNRVKNGGHNVPEEDIIRRYYKGIYHFEKLYKELVDFWILFYNGFSYTPVLVSTGIGDRIVVVDKERQQQFSHLVLLSANEVNIDV